MARCRVTFRDLEHHLFRRVELDADSPEKAAQVALNGMLDKGFVPENFAPVANVEVITTVEHRVAIRPVACCSLKAKKVEAA